MRFTMMIALIGVTGCATGTSDAALCGTAFTRAINKLDSEIRADKTVKDPVGEAATNVILGHDAGCK
jgi:dolichol kinase